MLTLLNPCERADLLLVFDQNNDNIVNQKNRTHPIQESG